jgi:hypothetical protein
MISDQSLKDIEKLAIDYCERNKLTLPTGYRLVVSVSIEPELPKFPVSVKRDVSLALLKENPWVLWQNYDPNCKISVIKHFPTMYKLVTTTPEGILGYSSIGLYRRTLLTNWLKTLGLSFGMTFPEHIAKEFEEVKKGPTLADLITQNLDD